MKQLITASIMLVALLLAQNSDAANRFAPLAGKWDGTVAINQKDAKGTGNLTPGTTGTKVGIWFDEKGENLTGGFTIEGKTETWTIKGDTYTWEDDSMTVTSTFTPVNKLNTPWIKEKAAAKTGETTFAFAFQNCKDKVAGSKACEQLPAGLRKNGTWVFKVKGNQLFSSVYYNFTTDGNTAVGQRILEQNLERTATKK